MTRKITVEHTKKIHGTVEAPAGKAYTHRALFIAGYIAKMQNGKTLILNPSLSDDNIKTMRFLTDLGIKIELAGLTDEDVARLREKGLITGKTILEPARPRQALVSNKETP